MKKKYKALIWALAALAALSAAYYFGFYLRAEKQILLVGGSTTVMRYASALGDGFTKAQDVVSVVCEGGGSTPGVVAVKNQAIDVAVTSRELTDGEDDDYTQSYLIARDAAGIYVNGSNGIENLTADQLRAVFAGEVRNWNQLGGADLPIRVIVAGTDSPSAMALNKLLLGGTPVREDASVQADDSKVLNAVARDSGAIGCALFPAAPQDARALNVDGVPLSRETVLTDRYPLSRSTYLVVHNLLGPEEDDEDTTIRAVVHFFNGDDEQSLEQKRADAIRGFIAFAKSAEGQSIIQSLGALSA